MTKKLSAWMPIAVMLTGCMQTDNDISFTINSTPAPTEVALSSNEPKPTEVSVDQISAYEADAQAIAHDLANVSDELISKEQQLLEAEQQIRSLPEELNRLRTKSSEVQAQLDSACDSHKEANDKLAAFESSFRSQKDKVLQAAGSLAEKDYQDAVAKIRTERIKRDETRRQIGARIDHQSEAQSENRLIRATREAAKAKLSARIDYEFGKLDGELGRLTANEESSREMVASLRNQLQANAASISSKSSQLDSASETLRSVRASVSKLRDDRAKLVAKRAANEKLLADVSETIRLQRVARERLEAERRQAEQLAANLAAERRRLVADESAPTAASPSAIRSAGGFAAASNLNASLNASPSGRYYNFNYRPPVGDHVVRGHLRSDGTYVAPHRRTDSDDSFWNNWSSSGNVNPYTGRVGTKTPPIRSGGGSTYVNGYFRSNGTYVNGHFRSK